jgi:hypothetical protein
LVGERIREAVAAQHAVRRPDVLGYGHLSGDLNSAVIAEKWGTLW